MIFIRALSVVTLLIGSLFPAVGGISLVSVGALGCLLFITANFLRTLPDLHWVIVFAVLLFLPFFMSSLHHSPAEGYGVEKMNSFFTLTLISLLAAATVRTWDDLDKLASVWILASIFLAVITLAGFSGGRAVGFDSNPIWLSRALGIGVLVSLWSLWGKRGKPLFYVLGIVVITSGMLATGSRGPLIGVVVGSLCLMIFSQGHKLKRFLVTITLVVGSWLVVLNHPFFKGSRIELLLRGDQDPDLSRLQMWDTSVAAIQRNPFGTGFGGWANATKDYGLFNYPHNIFLETFVEHGVFVGLIFAALVLWVLLRGLKSAKTHWGIALSVSVLLAEIVNVSVSGDLNARTFFFFLALTFLVTAKSGRSAIGDSSAINDAQAKTTRYSFPKRSLN